MPDSSGYRFVSKRRSRAAFAAACAIPFLVILSACNDYDPVYDRQSQFSKVHVAPSEGIQNYNIVADILNDDEILGDIGVLAVVGEYVIVGDAYLSPAVHIIRRSDGLITGQVGDPGEGPGEYMSVWRILPLGDDSFAVYDFMLRRFTSYSVNNANTPIRYQRPRFEGYPIGVGILDDLFIATGLFNQGRIQVVDTSGSLVRFLGPVPPGPPGMPEIVRQHAHHGVIATRPSSTQFVIANRYADELEFYQLDSTESFLTRGPAGVSRVYSANNNNGTASMQLGPNSHHGYVDVTASEKYVYALFSGRKVDESNSTQCGVIHVYNWQGGLVKTLSLDVHVTDIAASRDGRYLYAVRTIPSPAVVVFDTGMELHDTL